MNYNEADLRTKIHMDIVKGTELYYSLVKKEAKTMSFLSNERLLVYDAGRKILFYRNQYKDTPFKTQIPQPKNSQFTPLNVSAYKRPNDSKDIHVRYSGKNSKGQLQTIEWNFSCQTESLAQEWMNLLDNQKQKLMSKVTGQKTPAFIHDALLYGVTSNIKSQNAGRESILKLEQIESKIDEQKGKQKIKNDDLNKSKYKSPQPYFDNSMMRSSKEISKQENSKLFQSNAKNLSQNNSVKRDRHEKPSNNDWNYAFLNNPNESTIYNFQNAALKAFMSIYQKDRNNLNDPKRIYQSEGLRITVCNGFTKEATYLKREFRNYHFILQSSKNRMVVGVPLATLIEYEGVISLVKSKFPQHVEELRFSKQIMNEIKDLERYTRIMNTILQKATLYDLTQIYGSNADKRLIYVDNLIEYLPLNVHEQFSGTSLRPEYILDNVNQFIPGGDVKSVNKQQFKTLSGICDNIYKCIKQLSNFLSSCEEVFANIFELKQIFHNFGVNLKFLPKIYAEVSNKYIKKYIHTIMVAKVAKDYIFEQLIISRKQNRKVQSLSIFEDSIKMLIEGNSSNSSEIWKQISLKFKKQYALTLSNSEIVPGYFLNSLLSLLRVQWDVTKLNKNKKIFKQQNILASGFILSIQPKVKSYYRFTTEFIQRIKYACRQQKKRQEINDEIIDHLKLHQNQIPVEYQLNKNSQSIIEYLSYFTAPSNLDSSAELKHIPIFSAINTQPPTSFSLKITKNYLEWCNKKQKYEEFKKKIDQAISIADYWLEEGHLYHCQIFQTLSDYYSSIGNNQESINFMKQSLSICIKACGTQSKLTGNKYYELGERELKAGRKKDSMDNFLKAKINMQNNHNNSIKYPMLLMRLASLYLNQGNIQACIEQSLSAIKNLEQYEKNYNNGVITESYKIKTFQILSRAYQISGKKNELRQMALLCARKFNKAKNSIVFQQMVRICITAVIFKHSEEKCNSFLKIIEKLKKDESNIFQPMRCLEQLINMNETMVVMEKFVNRFQSIERFLSELNSKKNLGNDSRDFYNITRYLIGCVGEDYINGLIQQKKYE